MPDKVIIMCIFYSFYHIIAQRFEQLVNTALYYYYKFIEYRKPKVFYKFINRVCQCFSSKCKFKALLQECSTCFNFQGKFSSSPTVFATAEHYRSSMKHDAASVWLEDLSASSFKICIRERQNFARVHDDISVVSRFWLEIWLVLCELWIIDIEAWWRCVKSIR